MRIDDKDVLYDLEHAANELEPAYAATVHKSQGNEFTAVGDARAPGARPALLPEPPVHRGHPGQAAAHFGGAAGGRLRHDRHDKKTRRYTGLARFLKREDKGWGDGSAV